jgi:hypothetical protein
MELHGAGGHCRPELAQGLRLRRRPIRDDHVVARTDQSRRHRGAHPSATDPADVYLSATHIGSSSLFTCSVLIELHDH